VGQELPLINIAEPPKGDLSKGIGTEATDPRIYFAAERTLLAWLRTGIAIIGLGFLVARFGLFLAIARNPPATTPSITGSTVIGTGFVLLGSSDKMTSPQLVAKIREHFSKRSNPALKAISRSDGCP